MLVATMIFKNICDKKLWTARILADLYVLDGGGNI